MSHQKRLLEAQGRNITFYHSASTDCETRTKWIMGNFSGALGQRKTSTVGLCKSVRQMPDAKCARMISEQNNHNDQDDIYLL